MCKNFISVRRRKEMKKNNTLTGSNVMCILDRAQHIFIDYAKQLQKNAFDTAQRTPFAVGCQTYVVKFCLLR